MPDWGLLRNALNGGDLDGGKRKTRPPRFLHFLTCSGLLGGGVWRRPAAGGTSCVSSDLCRGADLNQMADYTVMETPSTFLLNRTVSGESVSITRYIR